MRLFAFFPIILLLISCQSPKKPLAEHSPDGKIELLFFLSETGEPTYSVSFSGQPVILPSTLGIDFDNNLSMNQDFVIDQVKKGSFDQTWEMPWGEQRLVRNQYNELLVTLKQKKSDRNMDLIFKIYNDGLGFRYAFSKQPGTDTALIAEENTSFNLAGNHRCWWAPGDWDIYEHLYNESLFTEIDALSKQNHPNLAQTYIPNNAVNTPVTMKTSKGLYLSFHEANLDDYAGMTLMIDPENLSMKSVLVGSENHSYKVKRTLPFSTPWRTIQISETATGLIESNLIVNLNEPNCLGDVSWVKPTKYVGIWWDMHLGTKSWDMASGKHGATTAYAKELIDFAAKNNIGALLVEGWNTGWEHWIGFEDREGVFDFVTPYPDYNLQEVVRYGKSKGVELIMHHETSAAPRTYEQQLDTAYSVMQALGIHAVKTGYVGKIIPKGEYHHGQWMVNHYNKVVKTAAKYRIAVNAHEPIKDTGRRRTYPNEISREGLRGQEFNAWASDGGNPPNHLPAIAFTRMLAGPIDYTPGIFNIKLKPYKPNNQVNTTLAHQLALYVVINSPIQMAADLIKYYEHHPAFQFIREVGINWEQSKALNGEPGRYVTIARQERGTGNWFIGTITNEEARELVIKLNFLDPGQTYRAILYLDGQDAHWNNRPESYVIKELLVDQASSLTLNLAPGGGAAISLIRQ